MENILKIWIVMYYKITENYKKVSRSISMCFCTIIVLWSYSQASVYGVLKTVENIVKIKHCPVGVILSKANNNTILRLWSKFMTSKSLVLLSTNIHHIYRLTSFYSFLIMYLKPVAKSKVKHMDNTILHVRFWTIKMQTLDAIVIQCNK